MELIELIQSIPSYLRSSPFSGDDDITASGEANIAVFNSPKSGVSLISLGDFEADLAKSASRARPQIDLILSRNGVSAASGMGSAAKSLASSSEMNKKRFAGRA